MVYDLLNLSIQLELGFLKTDIRLLAHFLAAMNQCLGREGNQAWKDEEFRARLWDAVDRGLNIQPNLCV